MLDSRERRKRRREWWAVAGLALLFIVLTTLEFRLTKISATLPFVNSIFFFGLLNVNIIILIAVVWLVSRNIGKIFLERRRHVLGSRLKTKLVIAFLGFSIIPTLVLFTISAMYINSSFDKWFSIRIQNNLQAAIEITHTYYRNADQTAMHFAEHLAKGVAKLAHPARSKKLDEFLESQRELLALDAIEYYSDPLDEREIASKDYKSDLPTGYPRMPLDVLDKAFSGEKVTLIHHVGSGDLIRCGMPVKSGNVITGVVVVDTYIPVSLTNKVEEIASVVDDYKETNPLKYPMKTAYLVILIMITLVMIFVAIWIGLFMARQLTVPVERLVHGAQAVGAGDLDVSIATPGNNDEISVLIESFNKMTRDLKDKQERLTQTSRDLEQRRLQSEAVLANVGTGVVVVDRTGEIRTFNRAVSKLLEILPEQALGKPYTEVLKGEASPLAETLSRVFREPVGEGSLDISQWNFRTEGDVKALACVVTPLGESKEAAPWGAVAVIDDMTYLIKGQREMAWREVARRIAHEIKNPLTPIKLSAQRMRRRLANIRGKDGELIQECTDTIIKHTDELKEMVNEFSNFARFPEISPAPHNLNEAISEVVALYVQGHPEVQYKFVGESKLPIFEFDRDQIKRVLINLFDNATGAGATIMQIETHFHKELQMAAVTVKDNGPGMTEEIRARVFEPYFSTKAGGTGLGLAIAKRIVNDHDGFIRVHSAPGEGTQFLIELPTTRKGGATDVPFDPDHR